MEAEESLRQSIMHARAELGEELPVWVTGAFAFEDRWYISEGYYWPTGVIGPWCLDQTGHVLLTQPAVLVCGEALDGPQVSWIVPLLEEFVAQKQSLAIVAPQIVGDFRKMLDVNAAHQTVSVVGLSFAARASARGEPLPASPAEIVGDDLDRIRAITGCGPVRLDKKVSSSQLGRLGQLAANRSCAWALPSAACDSSGWLRQGERVRPTKVILFEAGGGHAQAVRDRTQAGIRIVEEMGVARIG